MSRNLPPQTGVAVGADHSPVSAIILAGGVSRRMGMTNKLHLSIGAVPMLRHCVETILAASLGEVLVVLGHQRFETQKLIEDLEVRTVFNKAYRSGQMTTVICGLAVLKQKSSGVMICLGDQPALTPKDLNFLIDAFSHRPDGDVIIPQYKSIRGNPIIITDRCKMELLAGKYKLGCRSFVEKNPSLVHTIEMPNAAVTLDLDTPQDYMDFSRTRKSANADETQAQVV